VSEETAPQRIAVVWSPEARRDLRAIDRQTAMQILHCLDRYLTSRAGDLKKLKPPLTGFRPAAATTASFLITRKTKWRSPLSATARKRIDEF
jgi:hypothetical protein